MEQEIPLKEIRFGDAAGIEPGIDKLVAGFGGAKLNDEIVEFGELVLHRGKPARLAGP